MFQNDFQFCSDEIEISDPIRKNFKIQLKIHLQYHNYIFHFDIF